jgi:hypothetical protein
MGEEQTAVPPVIGVALLVVVVILLAVTTLLVFSPSIRERGHPGSYAIERSASSETFELTVQAADSSVPLDVRVDGRYVTTFDPEARRSIELTNVSAGDQITFVTNGSAGSNRSYIVYATTVSSTVGTSGPPQLLDPPEPPNPPDTRCLETIAELQAIELDGTYELCADIDAGRIDEWRPIGDADEPFTGSLDGNGHAIVRLTIENDTKARPAALFGYTTGTVRNLELRDVTISGRAVDSSDSETPGGLATVASTNAGTIRDVSASGAVMGTGDVGGIVARQTASGRLEDVESSVDVRADGGPGVVGGIVASNEGTINSATTSGAVSDTATSSATATGGVAGANRGEIRNSSAKGTVIVKRTDSPAGGLVGLNHGRLARSSATGTVTARNGTAGGIAAINGERALIQDTYATSAVTANASAGGLVAGNRGTIERSYAVGTVRAAGRAGGLLATDEGTVAHSYWVPNETEQQDSAGGPGASSRSLTAIRTKPAQLHGLTFGAVWETNDDALPRLDWETDDRTRD